MASNKFDSDASDNVHEVSSTSISFTDNSCPVSTGGTDTNQQTADTGALYNMQKQNAQQSTSNMNKPSANHIFENNIENLANDNIANTPSNVSEEDNMYHSTSTYDHNSVSVQDISTQDMHNNTNRDNTETTIASSSLQPQMGSTSIITPNHRRRNSRRTITQMESISETGHSVYEAANTSSSLSYTTPRRRRLRPHSTESASRRSSRSTESDTRRRRNRRYIERSNFFLTPDDEIEENNDDSSSRRRRLSNGNALVASLDAGMSALRRWINARRPSFGADSSVAGGGSSCGPNSVSSMTAMRLGEEDIFALSHTGSDQRTTLSDQNTSDGFLYYRPFEINVRDDVDVESALYASDDESGSTSRILHPLISSEYTESDHPIEEVPTSRQRAFSEPSRAHIREFISSVYGTRAIDSSSNSPTTETSRMNQGESSRHRESTSPSIQTSPMIIEEEIALEQTERANDTERNRIPSSPSDSGQLDISELELPDIIPPDNTLEPNDTEVEADGEIDPNAPSSSDDPNAEARIRWIRINRRFKFMISSVALIFSLLLFCILIAWVLLATTYVVSNKKPCDVPLKQYFWLVSTQLLLDVFRADIMKWLCQWPHSHRRVPPRVILYNVAYVSTLYHYVCNIFIR